MKKLCYVAVILTVFVLFVSAQEKPEDNYTKTISIDRIPFPVYSAISRVSLTQWKDGSRGHRINFQTSISYTQTNNSNDAFISSSQAKADSNGISLNSGEYFWKMLRTESKTIKDSYFYRGMGFRVSYSQTKNNTQNTTTLTDSTNNNEQTTIGAGLSFLYGIQCFPFKKQVPAFSVSVEVNPFLGINYTQSTSKSFLLGNKTSESTNQNSFIGFSLTPYFNFNWSF